MSMVLAPATEEIIRDGTTMLEVGVENVEKSVYALVTEESMARKPLPGTSLEERVPKIVELRSRGVPHHEIGRSFGFEGDNKAVATRVTNMIGKAKKKGVWPRDFVEPPTKEEERLPKIIEARARGIKLLEIGRNVLGLEGTDQQVETLVSVTISRAKKRGEWPATVNLLWTCRECGIRFGQRAPMGHPPIYCSPACKARARGVRKTPKECMCKTCGRRFSSINSWERIYCSSACYGKSVSTKAGRRYRGDDYTTRSQLEGDIRSLIRREGRYVSFAEVVDVLGVNWKVLSAFKVSIEKVNRSEGFKSRKNAFADVVEDCLRAMFPTVETEVRFGDCRSSKGLMLRFDFLADGRVLVEADGVQHQPGHSWHSADMAERDRIKDEWAALKGIPLVRIPYMRKKKDIEEAVRSAIQRLASPSSEKEASQ